MILVGIPGSIRRGSYNRLLLENAKRMLPEGISLEIYELNEIPIFNQDIETEPPYSVLKIKEKIRKADAVLIATPEYNYSISGVIKNALDWISRPYWENPLDGKAVAIMSASTGILGRARAQYHLRQVLVAMNAWVINKPEVMLAQADKKFDERGNLLDENAVKLLSQLLKNLISVAELLKKAK
ncbi:MAG: NADPH-dependent FMN reductase [Fervidicoccaceae archaeon]